MGRRAQEKSYHGKEALSLAVTGRGSVWCFVGGRVTSFLSTLRQKHTVASLGLILSRSQNNVEIGAV